MSRRSLKALLSAALVVAIMLPFGLWAELPPLQGNPPPGGGGGGGGSPTGSAGGSLGGSYPNPLVLDVTYVTTGVLKVANGGTGVPSLTAHGLLLGEGTSNVSGISPVASGSLVASAGTSSDPVMLSLGLVLDQLGPVAGGFLQRTSTANTWATHALVASDLPNHASRHNAGGADAMAIDASAATGSLRTLGTSSTQACAGNDSRLTNARTPSTHASTHTHGGSDAVGSSTPSANAIPYADSSGKLTAWVATMTGDSGSGGAVGLVPAPAAGTAAAGDFLRADGTWAIPAAATSTVPLPGATKTLGNAVLSSTNACLANCFDGTNVWIAGSVGIVNFYNATTRTGGTYSAGSGLFSDACFDGTFVWIVDFSNARLLKFNAATRAFIAYVAVSTAQGCCFDGTRIWVSQTAGTIVPVNPSTNSVGSTITVGTDPYGMCFDGTYLWVCNSTAGTVSQVNVSTLTVANTVTASASAARCCFDGTSVWVVCGASLVQITASTHTVAATISSGANSSIFYDGTHLWLTGNGGVLVQVDPISVSVLGSITLNSSTNTQGICSDGTFLWVNDYSGEKVVVYNPAQSQSVRVFKGLPSALSGATTMTSFTSSAFDSDYFVSGQVNVAGASAISTSLSVTFTDVSGTSRTMILPVTSTSGNFTSSGAIATTGTFQSPKVQIRAKGSTTISVQTSSGTFTSVSYTCSAIVERAQ